MGKRWRALRRRILTPNVSATLLDTRGFCKKNPDTQDLLETIGRMFLTGYAFAAEARTTADAEIQLEQIPIQFRGFAYEGAAMGFAIRDGLPLGGRNHVENFLTTTRGSEHIYMIYIGIGWAMARLPRWRWPKADTLDPLLRWLVLDGYGFHQAYFHTRRYVHEQFQDAQFPWTADAGRAYPNRAIDQGIGRAMWFVGGADAQLVADMIEKFPEERRPDLYSGAGLAASYAGGANEDELRAFQRRAGRHRGQLAQACAFAAEARVRAGLTVPHTEVATKVFCGMTPEQAALVTWEFRSDLPVEGDLPAFEVWRQRITHEFVSLGGVSK